MNPRLLDRYTNDIKPALQKKLNLSNPMSIPKLEKVVLNMGIGKARENKNWLTSALDEIGLISGQKAVTSKSKKNIANFKLRQGDPVGAFVTLRSKVMYEFLDRFISIASPRIRDFRGLSGNGFDGRGNYNFGITEQIIFPEIDYDKVNQIRGMNISIVTSSPNDKGAYELLLSLGMPIKENKKLNKE
tara:strand:- start:1122 stop:1685 length:564 start_codon:yes stop_codon:yes gene_type:complete